MLISTCFESLTMIKLYPPISVSVSESLIFWLFVSYHWQPITSPRQVLPGLRYLVREPCSESAQSSCARFSAHFSSRSQTTVEERWQQKNDISLKFSPKYIWQLYGERCTQSSANPNSFNFLFWKYFWNEKNFVLFRKVFANTWEDRKSSKPSGNQCAAHLQLGAEPVAHLKILKLFSKFCYFFDFLQNSHYFFNVRSYCSDGTR